MNECPSADALVTIGDALNWDVAEGLRHLERCDECRAELEGMRLTRTALLESEAMDEAAIGRVTAAIGGAAREERGRSQLRRNWTSAAEPLVAGVAAVIVLMSSGIRVTSAAEALLAFSLGAVLMFGGTRLARGVAALGFASTD
jgi:anti-sigma factor RsiW